jgi:hypothetical protein
MTLILHLEHLARMWSHLLSNLVEYIISVLSYFHLGSDTVTSSIQESQHLKDTYLFVDSESFILYLTQIHMRIFDFTIHQRGYIYQGPSDDSTKSPLSRSCPMNAVSLQNILRQANLPDCPGYASCPSGIRAIGECCKIS